MSLEIEIHRRLAGGQDMAQVAEFLASLWKDGELELTDKLTISSFLLSSGRKKTLLRLVWLTLERGEQMPWGHLLEAYKEFEIPPSVQRSLLEGAEAQGLSDLLLRSQALDAVSAEFAQARRDYKARQKKGLDQQRQALLDKLEYLTSQRMFAEEGRAIQEFCKRFPNDPLALKLTQSYEDRWAREIIAQKTNQTVLHTTFTHHEIKSDEELVLESTVIAAIEAGAKQFPRASYDLAILLYFLELYEPASRILEKSTSTLATDWFSLEVLLKGQRFVEALEKVTQLASKYAADPESTFAVTYFRARALYGLGQRQEASELLRSILKLRPDFRSAQVLLTDWTGSPT